MVTFMLKLYPATSPLLSILIEQPDRTEIDGLLFPKGEEITPFFWLEFLNSKLTDEPENFFWWSPRLMMIDSPEAIVHQGFVVGACGFKAPPDQTGSVEIGYGVIPSQQQQGFATQAVALLLEETFSRSEIKTIVAYTIPSESASGRVLAKNKFERDGSKIDPEDGEVWVWKRTRSMTILSKPNSRFTSGEVLNV
jgi:RimJ/RimL family protein N-acetyltransferase